MYSFNVYDLHQQFLYLPVLISCHIQCISHPGPEKVDVYILVLKSFGFWVGKFDGCQFERFWPNVIVDIFFYYLLKKLASNSPILPYFFFGVHIASLLISRGLSMLSHFFHGVCMHFCVHYYDSPYQCCSLCIHDFFIYYFLQQLGQVSSLVIYENTLSLSLDFCVWFLSEVIVCSQILNRN